MQQDNIIILGGPERRRRLIDISCSLAAPQYYRTLLLYTRALKQRNQQIKADMEQHTLHRGAWDTALIRYGSAIIRARREMIARIEEYIREHIDTAGISKLDVHLTYQSLEDEEHFEKKLRASKKQEDIYKTTVIGPHRDAILFLDHGRDMRDFSSQGQVRMTILAAKLALAEFLHRERGLYPVFLFDDILLEIDPRNAEAILTGFGERNQMFFASTTIPALDYFTRLPKTCYFEFTEGE
ncbi:MAG: hypothetical protein LBC99_00920 [Spirochaetota bacterium]|nr:hypothetical protein [Spirochaetota bacterium]